MNNIPTRVEDLYPWVEAETGMDFSGERAKRLSEAISKVLSRLNATKTGENLSVELAQRSGPLLERVTAELTIGESYFFRNEHHFRALREYVVPEILRDSADKREVRFWSAGCAGGEEPYSLAILLDQILSETRCHAHSGIASHDTDWRVSILGTDLNPEFLERARLACFRPWSFRQTKIHEDRRYFEQKGASYRLAPHIRDCVRFAYLNLVKDVYPSPLTGTLGLDLILFRNVAIYLKPDVTRAIVGRLYRALRPGGWLLLGESEVGSVVTDAFEVRQFDQATFHQKPKAGIRTNFDALCLAKPVLVEIGDASRNSKATQGSALRSAQPEPAVLSVPPLPAWVPLPKRTTRFDSSIDGSPATDAKRRNDIPPPQVERLVAEHRFDEAEQAIEQVPNRRTRAVWRLQIIQACLSCAEVTRARKLLDRTLIEEPLLIEAQLLQASLAEESGKWDAAEQAYRRALYIDRSCPLAHFHLALVQQQRGRIDAARRSLEITLDLVEKQDPHMLIEYGEGVCYGRLREMIIAILDD